MLEPQVAVAVADAAALRSPIQLVPMSFEQRSGEARVLHHLGPARGAGQRRERGEVVVECPLELLCAARGDHGCGGVEAGERRADGGHLRLAGGACRDPCRERVPFVEAAHLDRVIDRGGVVLVSEAQSAARSRDERADPEVDVRREPPVELDLRAAHSVAALRVA